MNKADGLLLLNVGCGLTYHPAWVNVDMTPADPAIMRWNVEQGLPFGDGSFDAVYSSHLLEHLSRSDARRFAAECLRVLKPGGVARFVVPDLERIAREYLQLVDDLRRGKQTSAKDYEWILLELVDQLARERTGGEMAAFLRSLEPSERGYVLSRIGEEAQRAWVAAEQPRLSLTRRVSNMGLARAVGKLRSRLAAATVRLVGGRGAERAFHVGLFRQGGEVHRWMYDEVSLAAMLRATGFDEVARQAADTSGIPKFASYGLDTDARGEVRKPDSLFMEALRPQDPLHQRGQSRQGNE